MKFLCISDMHGTLPEGLQDIVEKEKPSAILCAGDSMPHFWMGEGGDPQECIESLIQTGLPIFYTSGNMDDLALLEAADALTDNFHLADKKKFDLGGFRIIGFGSFLDPLSERDLDRLTRGAKKVIFINHRPPKGCLDARPDWWGGKDDIALREAMEKHKPALIVCGHIHESKGAKRFGGTLVVNAATGVCLVDIEDEKTSHKFL